MTGTLHEYKSKLLCSCCEAEKAVRESFGHIVLQCCEDETLDHPNAAFVNILKSSFKKDDRKTLNSLSFKNNANKILTSKGDIQASIDIGELDVVVLMDFLLHFKIFPTSYRNGDSLTCKYDDESPRHQKICCVNCETCVKCFRSGRRRCKYMSMRANLEEIKTCRNLYAHLTFEEYEDYERNGTFIDLLLKLHEAIAGILRELLSDGVLDSDAVTDRMDNMYFIRKKRQENYLSLYAKEAAVLMITPDFKQFMNLASNDAHMKIDVEMLCQIEKNLPWWRVIYDYIFANQPYNASFTDITESSHLKAIKTKFTDAATKAIFDTLQLQDSQQDSQQLFTVRITGFKKNTFNSQKGIVHFKLQIKWTEGMPHFYRELDSEEAMDTRREYCRALKQTILDVLQICVNVECIGWEMGSLLLEFIAFKDSMPLSTHEQNLIKQLLLSNWTRKIADDAFIGRFILQISFPKKSYAFLLIQLQIACLNEAIQETVPTILPRVSQYLRQDGYDKMHSLTVSSPSIQNSPVDLNVMHRFYNICLLGTYAGKNPFFTYLLNHADRFNVQVVNKKCLQLSISGSIQKALIHDYGCIENYASKKLFNDLDCVIFSYNINNPYVLTQLSILARSVHNKKTKVILLADSTTVYHMTTYDLEKTAVLLAQVGFDIHRESSPPITFNFDDITIPDLSQIQFMETASLLRDIGDTITLQYLYHRHWLMERLKLRLRSLLFNHFFPMKRKSRAVSGHPCLSQLNLLIPKTISTENGAGIRDFIDEDLPLILHKF